MSESGEDGLSGSAPARSARAARRRRAPRTRLGSSRPSPCPPRAPARRPASSAASSFASKRFGFEHALARRLEVLLLPRVPHLEVVERRRRARRAARPNCVKRSAPFPSLRQQRCTRLPSMRSFFSCSCVAAISARRARALLDARALHRLPRLLLRRVPLLPRRELAAHEVRRALVVHLRVQPVVVGERDLAAARRRAEGRREPRDLGRLVGHRHRRRRRRRGGGRCRRALGAAGFFFGGVFGAAADLGAAFGAAVWRCRLSDVLRPWASPSSWCV